MAANSAQTALCPLLLPHNLMWSWVGIAWPVTGLWETK